MSIQSVGGLYGPSVLTPRKPPQEGAQEEVRQTRVETPVPQEMVREQAVAQEASTATELSAEVPQGIDPELWSVLTGEERRFFAQNRGMGPVTYGRGSLGLAELGLQRGGRLDVKA